MWKKSSHSVASFVSWCYFVMISISFLWLSIALSGVALCDDTFGMKLTTEKSKTKEDTQYTFRYFVKDDTTGDYKIQEERKDGDSVHGSYTIGEPNGDLRTVTYQAGPGRGFEAIVDVQPSASPMKPTPNPATATPNPKTKLEKDGGVESTVKLFPGGFIMDVLSKPQIHPKTEVELKFSMKPNNFTEEIKTTDKPETTYAEETSIQTTLADPTSESLRTEIENTTVATEGRDISADEIEKEIEEMDAMPRLPDFILEDNKTQFKFHKDPEEALLDERITQIARQLAETGIRREYEERKLGHFIPISVRPIEPSPGYYSKSFKFTSNDVPDYMPSEAVPIQALPRVRLVPQYIYRQAFIPNFPQRLPMIETPAYDSDSLAKFRYKTEQDQIRPITFKLGGSNYDTTERETFSMMPGPTFFQFYSPIQRYIMQIQRGYTAGTEPDFMGSSLGGDYTTGPVLANDPTSSLTTTNDQTTKDS